MARTCPACQHPDCQSIDQALVDGRPYRDIARQFGTSKDALVRHKAEHVPEALSKAQDAQEAAHGDDLLAQVRQLQAKANALLDKAEAAGDFRTALAGIGQARACLELLAKLLGELDERPVVNLTLSAEWISVRAVLLSALAPFPDARAAVAARLQALEAS
jgi:hypothetical protein